MVALLLVGCAEGTPHVRTEEVRPVDEDQLALLPAGADAVLDVDLEQLRAWPAARRIYEVLPPDARAWLGQLGIDPWADLDGLVLALSQVGAAEPSSTLLVRGEIDVARAGRAIGGAAVDYRGITIYEAERAVARLSPRMTVFASPVDARRVIDLVRDKGESLRRADLALVSAFARAPSAKDGRPALIAGVVPSEPLRERLRADKLPGADYEWMTFVLAVGDGFDFEVIGKARGIAEAQTLALSAKKSIDELRARPAMRLLGLQPFLESIVVVQRGEEVRLVYRLPERRVDLMLSRIEQMMALAKKK
jgi:hypothetical protein